MGTMWPPEEGRLSTRGAIDLTRYSSYYNTPDNNNRENFYKENVIPNTQQVKRRVSFSVSSTSFETPQQKQYRYAPSTTITPTSSTKAKGLKRNKLPPSTPASVSRKILKRRRTRRDSSYARGGGKDRASLLSMSGMRSRKSFMTRANSPRARMSIVAGGRLSTGPSLGLRSARKIAIRRQNASGVIGKVTDSARKGRGVKGLFRFSKEDGVVAQEDALTVYLNFILVPSIVGSPRYMDSAKGSLSSVLHCESPRMVLGKIEEEINAGRLFISRKISVNSDLSVQDKIVELLLGNYHPVWLLVGFSTIMNDNVILDVSNGESSELQILEGLEMFIRDGFLKSDEIRQQFTQNGVFSKREADRAQNGHTLKHVLGLIYLLDIAKRSKDFQIPGDVPLFRNDSAYRSSQDVLLAFARDLLPEQGAILRYLSYKGYSLSYEENDIGVVDMEISNLFSDLRDGIRLAKLTSIITGDRNLLERIKIVNSPLQNYQKAKEMKLSNLGFALTSLARFVNLHGMPAVGVSTHDFVDGKKEKVLSALWNIVKLHDMVRLLDVGLLKNEIQLVENNFCSAPSSELPMTLEIYEPDLSETEEFLLRWAATVAGKYDFPVRDFTESFRDGYALCIIFHHYRPDEVPLSSIERYLDDADGEEAIEIVSHNLNMLHDACEALGIPNIPLTAHQALAPNIMQTKRETFGNPVQVILSNLFYHLASVNTGDQNLRGHEKVFAECAIESPYDGAEELENRLRSSEAFVGHDDVKSESQSLKAASELRSTSKERVPLDIRAVSDEESSSTGESPLSFKSDNVQSDQQSTLSNGPRNPKSPHLTPISDFASPSSIGSHHGGFESESAGGFEEKKEWATGVLMRVFTRYCILKKAGRLVKERRLLKAVESIQAFHRGCVVRKDLNELWKAAVVIQRSYRAFYTQMDICSKAESESENENVANPVDCPKMDDETAFLWDDAEYLESLVRGDWKCLVDAENKIAVWEKLAVESDLREKGQAATIIQQAVRSAELHKTMMLTQNAVLNIQSAWRSRELVIELDSIKCSSKLIQAAARAFRAEQDYAKTKNAASLIETSYRLHNGLLVVRKRNAVRCIERVYARNSDQKLWKTEIVNIIGNAYKKYRSRVHNIERYREEYRDYMENNIQKRRKVAVDTIEIAFSDRKERTLVREVAALTIANALPSAIRTRETILRAASEYDEFIASKMHQRKSLIAMIESAYINRKEVDDLQRCAVLFLSETYKTYRKERATMEEAILTYPHHIEKTMMARRKAIMQIVEAVGCMKAKSNTRRKAAEVVAHAYRLSKEAEATRSQAFIDYGTFMEGLIGQRRRAMAKIETSFILLRLREARKVSAARILAAVYSNFVEQKAIISRGVLGYGSHMGNLTKERAKAVRVIENALISSKNARYRKVCSARVIAAVYSRFNAQREVLLKAQFDYPRYIESLISRRRSAVHCIEERFLQMKAKHAERKHAAETISLALCRHFQQRYRLQKAGADYKEHISLLLRERINAIQLVECLFLNVKARAQAARKLQAARVIHRARKDHLRTKELINRAESEYNVMRRALSTIESVGKTCIAIWELERMLKAAKTIQCLHRTNKALKFAIDKANDEQIARESKSLGNRAGPSSLKAMYQGKKLVELGPIMSKLQEGTRTCSTKCRALLSRGCLNVIVSLVRECDQSPTGMYVRSCSLGIIQNIANDKACKEGLLGVSNLFEVLIGCAEMFRHVDSILSVIVDILLTLSAFSITLGKMDLDQRSVRKLVKLKNFLLARQKRHARYTEREISAVSTLNKSGLLSPMRTSMKARNPSILTGPSMESIASLDKLCNLLVNK
eukprot:Plantae.Rhodophyta-Hildenbrandia_rubra.ctg47.p1 GENE.Plantae.Rhodophyta-Hildenbrandia_rubra.ctg47~~Plantae.Rhodophyta-Hildenbrandia_rubra.ctg47.p1  ORF type:complete len:1833 (+),score=270.27 Plantae.Rhodophyta-Hildenbrandia_rubra.ctg47:324-5822(+)